MRVGPGGGARRGPQARRGGGADPAPTSSRSCAGGAARMPPAWDEFTANELGTVLAASRWDADRMLGLAHDLEVKIPGTKAAFLDGIVGPGEGRDHRPRGRGAGPGRGAGRRGPGTGAGGAANPVRPAVRDRPRRDRGQPGQSPQAAGDGGPGGTGRRRGGRRSPGTPPWGAGTAARRGSRRRPRITGGRGS